MKKLLLSLVVVTAVLSAPLAAIPASATSSYSFLMFSKDGITDPNEEDATMKTALEEIGVVTTFDGGDGSASAWQTALDGKDAVVFPEGDVYGDTDAMSSDAAAVVKAWIEAGGRAVGTGSYTHADFIDYLTGVTRTWDNDDIYCTYVEDPCAPTASYPIAVASSTLPQSLNAGNYTGTISNWADWTDADKANTTVIYGDESAGYAAVVHFAVGSGSFTYFAYDWYPDEYDAAETLPQWNEALRLAANGSFASAAAGTSFALDLELQLAVGDTVAGAPVEVSAHGLQPGSEWELVLRSTPITLDSGTVGGDGSVFAQVTIPAGLEVGWHTMTIYGTGTDGTNYQRVAHFRIGADGTLAEDVVYDDITLAGLASTGADLTAPISAAVVLLLAGIAIATLRRRRVASE